MHDMLQLLYQLNILSLIAPAHLPKKIRVMGDFPSSGRRMSSAPRLFGSDVFSAMRQSTPGGPRGDIAEIAGNDFVAAPNPSKIIHLPINYIYGRYSNFDTCKQWF